MSNASSRLKELYERYLSGDCSDAERKEFLMLLSADDADPELHALIDISFDYTVIQHQLPDERAGELFRMIRLTAAIKERSQEEERMLQASSQKSNRSVIIRLARKNWWAAASILLIGAAAIWLFSQQPASVQDARALQFTGEDPVQQNHSGAILTLADGKKLVIDSLKNGLITMQDGASVQLNENRIVYDEVISGTPLRYNTMSTPMGRQFRLQLPDGTEVMLNAGSSIRYPVHFNGKERVVFVEGEAWFDVKADAAKPFRVETAKAGAIEVLGTGFNIRCYSEEPVAKTTLLSGKIRYVKNEYKEILTPGQQLQYNANVQTKTIAAVDTSQVMAWKNGEFSFHHLTLEEAIREIARWYNLEPVYTGPPPVFEFYGSIGRDLQARQVVKLLNNMGLHITLEQNKLIISH